MNIFFSPQLAKGFETHFEYRLLFRNSDGGTTFITGVIGPKVLDTSEANLDSVLKLQTDFVKENWIYLEIANPNRDAYGRLVPGWIQDAVWLAATRNPEELS